MQAFVLIGYGGSGHFQDLELPIPKLKPGHDFVERVNFQHSGGSQIKLCVIGVKFLRNLK